MRRFRLIILLALLATLATLAACSEDAATPIDGDSDGPIIDGDEPEDGDVEIDPEEVTGGGSCDNPFVHPMADSGVQILEGNGVFGKQANNTQASLCGDLVDAPIDGDNDTEDDSDASPHLTTGDGPEIVVKVHLEAGDRVSVTFFAENADGVIMLRKNVCATESGCEALVDDMGTGQIESLLMVASTVGNYYLIFDTNEADARGLYSYHIEIKPAGEGDAVGEGKVGATCEGAGDCMTGYCLTTEGIALLVGGGDVTVPNGYCSSILCAVDGSDGSCTEEMGGECISLYAFAGDVLGHKGLCVNICQSDSDCRIEDDMRCFDPQEYVDQELLEQDVMEEYFGDKKACLPNDIIQAGAEVLMGMYIK